MSIIGVLEARVKKYKAVVAYMEANPGVPFSEVCKKFTLGEVYVSRLWREAGHPKRKGYKKTESPR